MISGLKGRRARPLHQRGRLSWDAWRSADSRVALAYLPVLAISFALAPVSIRISLPCARDVWLGLASAFAALGDLFASRVADANAYLRLRIHRHLLQPCRLRDA